MKKDSRIKLISLLITLTLVAGLFVFMFSGDNFVIFKSLFNKNASSEELIELIRNLGIKGAFSLSFLSLLQVVFTFLPAEPAQVLSGICYGFVDGSIIALIGVALGNSIMFLIYKTYGNRLGSSVQSNVDVDFDKLRSSPKVIAFIFLLYFLPAIPYGFICLFAASLDLKYPRYILLTTVGSLPSIFIGVSLGNMAMTTSWIVSVVVFGVILILVILMAIFRKKLFAYINKLIQKSQNAKQKEFIVQKPNKIMALLLKIGFGFILKTRVKFTKKINAKVEGPAIVICNHGSFYDFLYASDILKAQNPHFMIARLYFFNKKLAYLLKKSGAFPKSMFTSDLENAQNCLRVLRNGRVLALMPEARLSSVGKFEGIQPTTYKFLKRMGLPVYAIKISGDFFAMPKWGDKFRKGATVDAELTQLFTADEIKEASIEQVEEKVNNAISYDEFEWLKTRPELSYKHKTLAKGLENILYRCPHCNKEFTILSDKRRIYCSECGYENSLDDRYAFTNTDRFNNFKEWYEWQNENLKQEILSNPNYELKAEVELKLQSLDGLRQLRTAGFGTCTLNREGLTYFGKIDGETVKKFFDLKTVYRILFGAGVNFEVYEGKKLYFFVPNELRSCIKWYVASEILYENTIN